MEIVDNTSILNKIELTTKQELESITSYQVALEKFARRVTNHDSLYEGPCVYFIGNKANKLVKIGKSSRLKIRLRELNYDAPFRLEVFRVIPCKSDSEAFKLETYLHKFYKKFNCYGEWFNLNDDIDIHYASIFVSSDAEEVYNNLSEYEIEEAMIQYSNNKVSGIDSVESKTDCEPSKETEKEKLPKGVTGEHILECLNIVDDNEGSATLDIETHIKEYLGRSITKAKEVVKYMKITDQVKAVKLLGAKNKYTLKVKKK